MENFIYHVPTKIYFGKGQIASLKEELPRYGKKALLVYGGGSIKRNGIYDAIRRLSEEAGIELLELPGVEANPRITTVYRGVELCRREGIDMVLPAGGGSVIDCAKLVAAGACYEGDAWELVKHPGLIEKALPVICVLTVAATGSEMDHIAVISNDETQEKIGTRNPLLRPKASILDPSYTFSVSPYQTAAGVADIMSHAMESYFSREPADLQNYFAEAILRVCVENGKRLLDEPDNYEARANVMWAASWAINDTLKMGHMVQWSVHPIEHQLSAVYDVTHGEGLAILTPHWMRRVLDEESVGQFEELAVHIWKVKPSGDRFRTAQEGIACLERFFESLGLKSRLSQLGIDESHFEEMAAKAAAQVKGAYRELTKEDIIQIYRDSL
ncbi:MAG: iron-containing alcohol dehydrogenase [Candidatus Merdisoma sp.]